MRAQRPDWKAYGLGGIPADSWGGWQRARLQHDYWVAPDQMEWYFGPMIAPDPNFAERVPIAIPDNLRIHQLASHQYLDEMLEDGDVDAVMYASEVPSFRRGSPNVARLFPNFREVEADYFRRTGIFQVMHTVVIKRDIYDKAPWVAISLYEAFVKAKGAAIQRQQNMGALFSMLPWIGDHLREQREIIGDDPFAYGLERNRGLLETFFQYSLEQGLVNRALTLEELVAPETLG